MSSADVNPRCALQLVEKNFASVDTQLIAVMGSVIMPGSADGSDAIVQRNGETKTPEREAIIVFNGVGRRHQLRMSPSTVPFVANEVDSAYLPRA